MKRIRTRITILGVKVFRIRIPFPVIIRNQNPKTFLKEEQIREIKTMRDNRDNRGQPPLKKAKKKSDDSLPKKSPIKMTFMKKVSLIINYY